VKLTSSIAAWPLKAFTTTRITAMIVNRRAKSSRSMLFCNSCPMPPAPTTPSTVEARTLKAAVM